MAKLSLGHQVFNPGCVPGRPGHCVTLALHLPSARLTGHPCLVCWTWSSPVLRKEKTF